jgi:hypothetical protein
VSNKLCASPIRGGEASGIKGCFGLHLQLSAISKKEFLKAASERTLLDAFSYSTLIKKILVYFPGGQLSGPAL